MRRFIETLNNASLSTGGLQGNVDSTHPFGIHAGTSDRIHMIPDEGDAVTDRGEWVREAKDSAPSQFVRPGHGAGGRFFVDS